MAVKAELNESLVNQTFASLQALGVIPELSKVDEAQQGVNRKWAKIAGLFYKGGIRAESISGDARVREVVEAVRRTIVASWPEHHQRLLATKGQAVSEMSDSDQGLRAKRQADIGAYVGLLARHLRKLDGPKTREKKEKVEDKAAEPDDPIVLIQGLLARKTKLVDVTDVDRFESAGLEMIALMRRVRKT